MSNDNKNVMALLVIDMQVGLFNDDTPRYDADGVVQRINALSRSVRKCGDIVVFIQHRGPQGDPFEPGTDGWQLLPLLERYQGDIIVSKTACDSFYNTELSTILSQKKVKKLIITGCATDVCVDTTVRAATSHDYQVIVVADGHTTADRPHIDAVTLIRHHNWLWQNLIHPRVRIEVIQTNELIDHCNKNLNNRENSARHQA